jgi:hypothetical protein
MDPLLHPPEYLLRIAVAQPSSLNPEEATNYLQIVLYSMMKLLEKIISRGNLSSWLSLFDRIPQSGSTGLGRLR